MKCDHCGRSSLEPLRCANCEADAHPTFACPGDRDEEYERWCAECLEDSTEDESAREREWPPEDYPDMDDT